MNLAYLNSNDFSFFSDAQEQLDMLIEQLKSEYRAESEHGDIESFITLLLDEFFMRTPVRLDQYIIDLLDRDIVFTFPTSFDKTAIAEVTTQSQITLSGTYDKFGRTTVKGINAHASGFKFLDNIML